MVKERMDLLELLRKGGMDGDVDFLREALRVLVEGIMDAEVSARIGAEYGERSPERVTQRNGYRSRAWDTRVGTMDLHIPKLREGSYFPSLLEPRRRSERALLAVIQQAYVEGVSTRRVDDLVKALGCEGISKSQVSRICQELDVVVDGFMGRPLDAGPYPYLWLDALTQKVREDGRIVNVSVVVATAVNGEGKREIIGMDVGTSEDGAFWLAFLRSLSAKGLGGVELVVSDAHQGLRGAIAAVFGGASWQRCRTHFMTNLLTRVPRRAQPWVATMVRTIYQQPSPDEVHAQLDRVTDQLQNRFPQVASLRGRTRRPGASHSPRPEPDVLAFVGQLWPSLTPAQRSWAEGDRSGRREESGRGVREHRGNSLGSKGGPDGLHRGPYGRLRELRRGMAKNTREDRAPATHRCGGHLP